MSILLGLGGCLLFTMLLLKIVFAELNKISWIVSYNFFAEFFQDLRQILRNLDLIGAKDAHLTNVSHFIVTGILKY